MSITERVCVSPNHRFLMTTDRRPFFWLADTAWELFQRLTLKEAEEYFETRKQQGFNLIQATVLAELEGLSTPNAHGHIPLIGDDPLKPNEFYFRDMDAVIRLAEKNGMYVGLLPTWGDKVHKDLWGVGPVIFTMENVRQYGNFLGNRYRNDRNVIWILGGDRPGEGYQSFWEAMADGIADGVGRKPFMTYHPWGGVSSPDVPWCGCSSSSWFHEAAWLDMNMLQSGHVLHDAPVWDLVTLDYFRTPMKPVLDGEPNYEGHPVDPFRRHWSYEFGRFSDYDVRKQAYRSVFSGACGFTYGHHSVWQFWHPGRKPINFPMPPWQEAIFAPGAWQLIYLKSLLLSRPYFSRIPAPDMVIPVEDHFVGLEGDGISTVRAAHICATRCSNGSYVMVYVPNANQRFRLDLKTMHGNAQAWWFDPRNGRSYQIGEFTNQIVEFVSPIAGPDWILVVDEIERKFGIPGGCVHNE